MNDARVVVTGFGAVSPFGLTAADMWAALCAGKCGIRPIITFDPASFDCRIAGQVPDYKIQQYVPRSFRKAIKLMSRDIELAIIAAHDALTKSGFITKGIDPESVNIDPTRVAINLGAGLISCDLIEIAPAVAASVTDGKFDIHKWGKIGMELVTPLWLLKYLPNMLACHVGIIHDIQGPSNTITCGEASASLAISEAVQIIARGSSDVALAGGADARVNPTILIRACLLGRVNTESNSAPDSACRPFDADARGSVTSEAGGIVVLENLDSAKSRQAKIFAEVVGVGESNNINPSYDHIEADNKGIQLAIEKALAEAGIRPDDLDLIIPHGTGIAADDRAEAKAIEAVLGTAVAKVPIWPTKSMLGTAGAASGALDIIAAVCAIGDSKIPAAKNCDKKIDGCNLNIVTQPQQTEIRYAICCSYTYGGQTAAILLKKYEN